MGLLKHVPYRCVAGAALIGGRVFMVRAIGDARAVLGAARFLPARDDPHVSFRWLNAIALSLR